ncbi:MAG: SUMF1/EgtB/PvdO family nonheme iron enzyme [Ktedonobacterales bacterium]
MVCGVGSRSVLRGGSWNNDSRNARAAYRNDNQPANANNNNGFRLVAAPDDSTAPGQQTRACPGNGERGHPS